MARNRRQNVTMEQSAGLGASVRRLFVGALRAAAALVLAGGVAAGAVAGWNHLRSSGTFTLEEVAFEGVHRALPDGLVRRAGLTRGMHLFDIDLAAAASAMDDEPWVASARVSRVLPRTLRVTVVEHVPFALVAAGGLYVSDAEGLLFKRWDPADGLDLPVVTGLSGEAVAGGRRGNDPGFLAARALIEAHRAAGLEESAPLGEVSLRREGADLALTAWLGERPVEVRFGAVDPLDAESLEAKLARLRRVWDALEDRGARARSIDLGNRARPDWVAARVE